MEDITSNFEASLPLEHYKEVLKNDVRPDGRDLGKFRKMTINVGSISTADGSALVQMGNTMVVCGVKGELTKPPASKPDCGIIVPNVDLSPMCAAHFKPGPPSEQAQVASQLLNDIIKTCDVINLDELCIFKDKLVWVLYCDVVCLSYDGNLNDACIMALVAALESTTLPKIKYNEENDVIETLADPEQRSKLIVRKRLVSSTFVLFDSTHLIADPTLKEEEMTSGVVTIVTDDQGKLCHLHRPGGFPLRDKQLEKCIKAATRNGQKLHSLLQQFQ
ncbi:exosome complex component RRP43-like [Styela clava]